jgi:hypothetical protein
MLLFKKYKLFRPGAIEPKRSDTSQNPEASQPIEALTEWFQPGQAPNCQKFQTVNTNKVMCINKNFSQ